MANVLWCLVVVILWYVTSNTGQVNPKSKDCYYQGAPVATLLTGENATVTLCHSKTENIESIVCMLLSCR